MPSLSFLERSSFINARSIVCYVIWMEFDLNSGNKILITSYYDI